MEEFHNLTTEKLKQLKNQYENEMSVLNGQQMVLKTAINSFYGAVANAGSRWNSIDLAEAITSSGQLSVKWAIDVINKYLNKTLKTQNVDYVIASDTDSAYIELKDLVKKLNITNKHKITDAIVKFCDIHLHKEIKNGFDDLAILMNAYDPQIKMARENIADRAIWTAKKHYVMNVLDSKGVRYDKPKLKMVGIEAIKSTIPMICKQKIKDGIQIIMEKDNTTLLSFIDEFRKEFRKLPFEEVAFPRGVNDLKKYTDRRTIYSKGVPLHVRGALLYNHYIDVYKLEKQYNKIQDGSKTKYSYLLVPNPIKENVISSPDILPKEFNLDKYIDYNTNFDKSFLAPLDSLCSVIGWKTDNSASLEGLFG